MPREWQRFFVSIGFGVVGLLALRFGPNTEWRFIGWVSFVGSLLGLLGVNVWIGGPIDKRLDRLPEHDRRQIITQIDRDSMRGTYWQLACCSIIPAIIGVGLWQDGKVGGLVAIGIASFTVLIGVLSYLGLRSTKP